MGPAHRGLGARTRRSICPRPEPPPLPHSPEGHAPAPPTQAAQLDPSLSRKCSVGRSAHPSSRPQDERDGPPCLGTRHAYARTSFPLVVRFARTTSGGHGADSVEDAYGSAVSSLWRPTRGMDNGEERSDVAIPDRRHRRRPPVDKDRPPAPPPTPARAHALYIMYKNRRPRLKRRDRRPQAFTTLAGGSPTRGGVALERVVWYLKRNCAHTEPALNQGGNK